MVNYGDRKIAIETYLDILPLPHVLLLLFVSPFKKCPVSYPVQGELTNRDTT